MKEKKISKVFGIIKEHKGTFRKDFHQYMFDNYPVWEAFETEALKVAKHRTYYSGYTIREVLRHYSAISEINTDYKISNNFTPDMCRLFMILHPRYGNFFRIKERTAV